MMAQVTERELIEVITTVENFKLTIEAIPDEIRHIRASIEKSLEEIKAETAKKAELKELEQELKASIKEVADDLRDHTADDKLARLKNVIYLLVAAGFGGSASKAVEHLLG